MTNKAHRSKKMSNGQPATQNTAPVDSSIAVAARLRKSAPDYDSWSYEDMTQLGRDPVQYIAGRIGGGQPYDNLIPKSFFTKYGDGARAMFARGVTLAAKDNHDFGYLADSLIRLGLQDKYRLTAAQQESLDLTTPISLSRADGSVVRVPASEAVTYLMAQEMNANRTQEAIVTIPSDIMRQVVENNRSIISTPWDNTAPQFKLHDEAAYFVGNALGNGYGNRVGQLFANEISPSRVCTSLPGLEQNIFNPKVPNLPIYQGLLTGYARGKVGECSTVSLQSVPDVRGASASKLRAVG